MCYPSSNTSSNEPTIFRAIEAPNSVAGENHDAKETAEQESNKAKEQISKPPTPSKQKVTIGETTFLPIESDDEGKSKQPPAEKHSKKPAFDARE